MAELQKNMLTIEERDELQNKLIRDIQTILMQAHMLEKWSEILKRLDTLSYDAVYDLMDTFLKTSRYSESAKLKTVDFLTVLAERMSKDGRWS